MEKNPSYRSVRLTIVRLIEIFHEKHTYALPGNVKVSVLERCPCYEMSVLRGFTVFSFVIIPIPCTGSAKLIKDISRSNNNGFGKYFTDEFYCNKYSKMGASEAYYSELLCEWAEWVDIRLQHVNIYNLNL